MASDTPATVRRQLQNFIRTSSARPFDWLDCNCGFWVCEWIKIRTGCDPVAEYRGKFKTPLGFRRFVTKHGGNENFSRSVAAKAGLEQTSAPMLGDVGLVYADGATMAIKADGPHWIVKRHGEGIAIGPFRPIVAWML
jgi:hypothetical protein